MKENNRIRGKVPALFTPLIGPHFEKVDEVLSPGLSVIRWSSLNLTAFVEAVNAALTELEQLIDRINGIHKDRIQVAFKCMLKVPLCELPDSETVTIDEFVATTSTMCAKAYKAIETRSQVVERAVNELIDLLVGPEEVLVQPEDESAPGAVAMIRKIEKRTKLLQEAENLRAIYEQQNVDTLVILLKTCLESIRKRIAVHSTSYSTSQPVHPDQPLFESDMILAVPDVIMKPSLDEIQQCINQAVATIISISKHVYFWGQDRFTPVPPEGSKPLHSRSDIRSRSKIASGHVKTDHSSLKNYSSFVSEHKEILKLSSFLSTAINSTKSTVVTALDMFNKYSDLWKLEQQDTMKEFLEDDPSVIEFSNEMQKYAELDGVITLEPDVVPAGAIALSTEKLKLALCTEAKAWKVCYGRTMDHKYQTIMDEVFKSIDDWSKRLSQPLNDLDDIRAIMFTLKEIRENEIRIDMSLGPIEVSQQSHTCWVFYSMVIFYCCL